MDMTRQEFDAIRAKGGYLRRGGLFYQRVAEDIEFLLAEINRLSAVVDVYAISARTIALYLKPYCDGSLSYADMITDASRKASIEIDNLRIELNNALEGKV